MNDSNIEKKSILPKEFTAISIPPVQFNRLTVVIKPTQACNLACTYCYVFDRSQHAIMTDQVLRIITAELIRSVHPKGKLIIIWHGGEPSLCSVDFFQRAISYQNDNSSHICIENIFQTNAYKMSDRLLTFLAEHGVSVGVSVDGPAFLHDRCRVTHRGQGTFADVIHNIYRLRDMEIPSGAVCVISKQNKDHAQEIYDFFHAEQIPFKINPLINTGAAKEDRAYHHITPDEYAEVVLEFFRLWYEDKSSTLRVATIENIIDSILTGVHAGCHNAPNCQQSFLAIGPTGDVYPCGRFEGRTPYCYGNVTDRSLSNILKCDLRTRLLQRKVETIPACGGCTWQEICHGGCMHNALEDTGDVMNQDRLCSAYKKIYAGIDEVLQEELGPLHMHSH